MAARASCSTPACFPRRRRVRARLVKKVGSWGFFWILFLLVSCCLAGCSGKVEGGVRAGVRLGIEVLSAIVVTLFEELVALVFQRERHGVR